MDDGLDGVFGKNAAQQFAVADVALIKGEGVAGDFGDAADNLGRGVAEVVDNHGGVPRLDELDHGVRTDKAGAAGNEDGGHGVSFLFRRYFGFTKACRIGFQVAFGLARGYLKIISRRSR